VPRIFDGSRAIRFANQIEGGPTNVREAISPPLVIRRQTKRWAPKTIATALATVGAGLAWKGDAEAVRSVGAGAMSAAGSQLALMMIDEREKPATALPPAADATKKPANAGELPPGALEAAFERAKARLASGE
jgi:hypothetical protein